MINTRAKEMMGKIGTLSELLDEDMTSHNIMGGVPMGFPSEYRGMAKVTKVLDGAAKDWVGMDQVFFVDVASGETSLMDPKGDMLTLADLTKVFSLETFTPHP